MSGAASIWGCTGAGFDVLGTPESVEVLVDARDGSWTGSVSDTPAYESNRPNRPNCPPRCSLAELAVAGEPCSTCIEWVEDDPLCVNGVVDPIEPCCEVPAPPEQPEACEGDESSGSPSGSGEAPNFAVLARYVDLHHSSLPSPV